MVTDAPETPLARRFAAELRAAAGGRSRIRQEAYLVAFARAEPALATSPLRRERLRAAIEELVAAGVVVASRSEDRTERPPLPRFLLVSETLDEPASRVAARYPWRPELAWAARLPLRRSELELLVAINAYLRDRPSSGQVVPLGERSLALTGDEKRLDGLERNKRLFGPGRVTLNLLRARRVAPPFAWRRVGDGPVALVVENQATFRSVCDALPAGSPVGLVVFGSGAHFAASVAYLAELPGDVGLDLRIHHIRYFGDLDRRGLEIPIAADLTAREAGLPPVRPAVGLWARLLARGRLARSATVRPEVAGRICAWLPESLAATAADVLMSGHRLAQEAVGVELLRGDPSWADWPQLGPPVEGPST
jgi:hypothetical protein